MKKLLSINLLLLFFAVFSASAQVTNISATFACPAGVVVSFDLNSANPVDVTLYYSHDSGQTWLVAQSISGDITNQTTGTGKTIVWDNQADNVTLGRFRLRVEIPEPEEPCCPGLIIPGGAFVERSEFVTNLGTQALASTDNATATANINYAINAFTRSGEDLCVYFRDASITTMTHANALLACGPGGIGIDDIHRDLGGWRLPNIAELAQLGRLVTVSNTATLTQAQVDAFSAGANVPFPNAFLLPAGTQITHDGTFNNLHRSGYWSSSRQSATLAWVWYYGTNYRSAWSSTMGSNAWVRCVRSF